MLSFQLSAIDVILAIAVIVLLILYMTKSSAKSPAEEKLLVEKEIPSKKPVMEDTKLEKGKETERPSTNHEADSTKCPFSFGYLKKLSKEASIPDKCLSCPRIMDCYVANE